MSITEYLDDILFKIAFRLPEPLGKWYIYNERFQRFVKFGLWCLIEYWILKSPMIWFMTEIAGIHYLVSSFISGVIAVLIGYALSDLWIWKQ